MKTKVIKRVIAFALATLIILGTLGYFFSMVAWAAETIGGDDVNCQLEGVTPVTKNNKITAKITFSTNDATLKGNLDKTSDITLELSGNSFQTDGASKLEFSGSGGIIPQP